MKRKKESGSIGIKRKMRRRISSKNHYRDELTVCHLNNNNEIPRNKMHNNQVSLFQSNIENNKFEIIPPPFPITQW